MQLDKRKKGFSIRKDGPLDMRMDPRQELTAKEIINTWSEDKLGEIFREFGEEPRWRRAARAIVEARASGVIETTGQLAHLLAASLGRQIKRRLHPATLIFQALRICVNREIEAVAEGLSKAIDLLAVGGCIGIMGFHSLENRIAKTLLKQRAFVAARNKYRQQPNPPSLRLMTNSPCFPSQKEKRSNPRSRSAQLRFAKKVGP